MRTRTRISADDALQLASDRRAQVPMQIGALLQLHTPQAGDPDAQEVAAVVARRLGAVPQLRRRLQRPPLLVGRPAWVEDDGEEPVVRVVRLKAPPSRTAAPPGDSGPGGVERLLLDELADLVTTRLPRDRPLWRAEVLADEAGHALGIVLVAHHVVTDGVGALTLLGALADPVTEPATTEPRARRGGHAPEPRTTEPPTTEPRTRHAGARRLAWAARELGGAGLRTTGRTTLLRPTGPLRRVEVVDLDLELVRAAAPRHDATVNELVLVALSGALTRLLAARGDHSEHLVVSVPVSGRASGPELGNAVGVLPVRIPFTDDLDARFAAVRVARQRLHTGHRGSSTALLGPAFRVLAALGALQWFVRHQRLVHTFETNIRGPERMPTVAGVRVARVVPMAVNPGNVTVSFDVLSLGGRLVLAIVADPDHVPDQDLLTAAIRRELDRLLVERRPAPRAEEARVGR